MLIEVIFRTTMELDEFIGVLQKIWRYRNSKLYFSTLPVEHRGIDRST